MYSHNLKYRNEHVKGYPIGKHTANTIERKRPRKDSRSGLSERYEWIHAFQQHQLVSSAINIHWPTHLHHCTATVARAAEKTLKGTWGHTWGST